MTEDRDPLLQSLFAESQQDLDGDIFVANVMRGTRRQRYRLIAGATGIALVLAITTWQLALPLQNFAQLLAQALTITLVDLGDSWLAWLFAPINNVASLLILSIKAIRSGKKRIVGASFVN